MAASLTRQQKQLFMADDYKKAVSKRQTDVFRQQANDIVQKEQNKKKMIKAQNAKQISRRQKKINAKNLEIANYMAKLKKAEKTVEEDVYGLIGIGTLIMFILFIVISVVVHFAHREAKNVLALLVVGLIFLIISIVAQSFNLEASNKIDEYKTRIDIAKKELTELNKSPFV